MCTSSTFFELVLTDHAARVLAVDARFRPARISMQMQSRLRRVRVRGRVFDISRLEREPQAD
jgi:hypothetical protein